MTYTQEQINEVLDFRIRMKSNNIDTKNVVYMLGGNAWDIGLKGVVFGEIAGIIVGQIVGFND